MKQINLSRGAAAIVDDTDYEVLTQHSWHVLEVRGNYYAVRNAGAGEITLMHHMVIGRPPVGYVTDHINDNGLDNRRSNLRHISNAENIRRAYRDRPDSGIQYIERLKSKPWRAEVSIDGKGRHIGYFATKEEAQAARAQFLSGADKDG